MEHNTEEKKNCCGGDSAYAACGREHGGCCGHPQWGRRHGAWCILGIVLFILMLAGAFKFGVLVGTLKSSWYGVPMMGGRWDAGKYQIRQDYPGGMMQYWYDDAQNATSTPQ